MTKMIDMINDEYFHSFWDSYCEITNHDANNTVLTADEYDEWLNIFADHMVEIESDDY